MSGRRLGSVRIVAGAKRGRRLNVLSTAEVRPTSEMVREAVFDVLGPVGELSVLDLFAGTGAMGLEALSRGARACTFVETDSRVASVLRGNIKCLEYDQQCSLRLGDYGKVAATLVRAGEQFDLLFVDPPYRMLAEVEARLAPAVASLMKPRGVVVIEGPRAASVAFGGTPIFEREYGDTKIIMVRPKG